MHSALVPNVMIILRKGSMDVASSAQRVGGGGAGWDEGRQAGLGLEGQQAGGVEDGGGTYQLQLRREVKNTGKTVQGGKGAKLRRESKKWPKSCKEVEEEMNEHCPITGFPDNQGWWPPKQTISYQDMSHTVGLVGTGRPNSEPSFYDTAVDVEMSGSGRDSTRWIFANFSANTPQNLVQIFNATKHQSIHGQ